MLIVTASLSSATIAPPSSAHSLELRCRVAEISRLFAPATAHSLFEPENSLLVPASAFRCTKGQIADTRSGFEAVVVVEVGCMREVRRGVS